MSKIVSIGTAVPAYSHKQEQILDFMQRVFALNEADKRKMRFLYKQGGIDKRYSVIPDYSLPAAEWQFYSPTENLEPFPTLEQRMQIFQKEAAKLSVEAINKCVDKADHSAITHLITVSCTGLSAPGLDLEIMEMLGLDPTINRTSVNFMGCYAAIHAMKLANAYCLSEENARVLIVCTELCTLHFQKEHTIDNITSSMLFADGSAALLICSEGEGVSIDHFYSAVAAKGKKDMAWELSSHGFQMTLSGYIADLIGEDFNTLVSNALSRARMKKDEIDHWCIHPGGKKILESVHKSLGFANGQLDACYSVLKDYGNMSSPTVLFVLDKILKERKPGKGEKIFGAAFGPGLTIETFILSA